MTLPVEWTLAELQELDCIDDEGKLVAGFLVADAFEDRNDLEGDTTLSPGVTSVCIRAFKVCSSATSFTFQDGLTSVGDGAF